MGSFEAFVGLQFWIEINVENIFVPIILFIILSS